MQRELAQRLISGVVLGTVVIASAVAGGLAFRLLTAALPLLIFREWSKILQMDGPSPHAAGAGWLTVTTAAALIVADMAIYIVPVIVVGGLVTYALARGKVEAGWFAFGVVYAGLSGMTLSLLRDDSQSGMIIILFLFAVVWSTDSLAYFVGRAFGGPKLAPRISPGKTWSGAVGGALSGMLAGGLIALAAGSAQPSHAMLLALFLSIASQTGDLFESWFKRHFKVKDSGRLIPGHGGVMDRVDGLVFAAFAAFMIAVLLSFLERGPDVAAGHEARYSALLLAL